MNLEVTLAGKTFKNPVTTASGTFGSGAEYEQFVDLQHLAQSQQKVWRMYRGRAILPLVWQKLMVEC